MVRAPNSKFRTWLPRSSSATPAAGTAGTAHPATPFATLAVSHLRAGAKIGATSLLALFNPLLLSHLCFYAFSFLLGGLKLLSSTRKLLAGLLCLTAILPVRPRSLS
ncbi:MAG: hypothetical protein ACE145_13445 [Terriglobia bacterium]